MLENIFKILGIIGFIAICVMAFTIPSNPFETIKGVNYYYPIFLCIIMGGGILYLLILYGVYSIINRMYIKYLNRKNIVRVK